MRFRPRVLIVALIAVVTAATSAACTLQQGFQDNKSGENVVRLVQQPWEDLIVENEIVSQVLSKLGYRAHVQELSVPLGAQALADGQADAYLGNWWPSQQSAYQQYLDSGQVEVAGTMVTGAQYAPVVPDYVAQEYGIRSLADLDAKAHLFDNEILGIEQGTPGNQYILDAIRDDSYGLGDWNLVQSSTAAMLSEVQRRAGERKPVVFLGWSPHWMNVEWDLHYLDDPQDVWPGSGEIRVVFNEDFAGKNPDIAKFLSQIRIDRDTASDWIFRLSKEKDPAPQIASEWIRAHPDEVRKWLRGVRTADGEPAPAAIS
ncbi:ABC transporter substrate-binding protein [Saccharomonospora sp.]|uniref:ABC transporter substrate-binding protein n=1 Tax=Saccharomonospora sp. TaxID=33913 RepID=UPI00262F87FB|nr:ABC transporter substrate-binding protein [Saccharomonospora sp.]